MVEKKFERTGRLFHVHHREGVIRTTPEHPFYVKGKGWTEALALQPDDMIATASGEWVEVTEVFDTGVYEKVYNLQVADYHTYFVREEGWNFEIWAHNTACFQSLGTKTSPFLGGQRLLPDQRELKRQFIQTFQCELAFQLTCLHGGTLS